MGLNTAVVVLNDHLHEIERDPKFGQKVADAIRDADNPRRHHRQNSFAVLSSAHADGAQIVVVGGNLISRIGMGHYRDDPKELLRKLARDLGYRIVKLPEPRP